MLGLLCLLETKNVSPSLAITVPFHQHSLNVVRIFEANAIP
jgi:hypothetical protein